MLPRQDRELLAAVAEGRIVRADGDRIWAPYELNGEDVTMALRRLATAELVVLPLMGPPRLTPSGERALRIR